MLTVPQAARRARRNAETIRRWIRSGRLRARKIGTQHVIEEEDLAPLLLRSVSLPLPKDWRRTWTGEPHVSGAEAIRRTREGR